MLIKYTKLITITLIGSMVFICGCSKSSDADKPEPQGTLPSKAQKTDADQPSVAAPTQTSAPKTVPAMRTPFKFDTPRVIRDQQGELSIELPITNLKPYPLTLIAPPYNSANNWCGEKIIDDKGKAYSAQAESKCSVKSADNTHSVADIINKGQELRPNEKATLLYTLYPVGGASGTFGDTIKLFRLELIVVHRDETNKPFIETNETINIPSGIKIE